MNKKTMDWHLKRGLIRDINTDEIFVLKPAYYDLTKKQKRSILFSLLKWIIKELVKR